MIISTLPNKIYRLGLIMLILWAFLLSLDMMGAGFKLMSKDIVDQVFGVAGNPFISLFIGLFATAMMQSSTTTTSIIVILVASGALPLQNAVPMIMGANIGTSVTSTLVALGHIHKKEEFRSAISAATVHDFFNIMVVMILFPLEMLTGYLSTSATYLAHLLPLYSGDYDSFSLTGVVIDPVSNALVDFFHQNVLFILILSLTILVASLRGFTILLQKFIIGRSQAVMDQYVFGHPFRSLCWGAVITAGVQSSSVTASLVVPLVASGKVTLHKAFPFLIGANIGTTLTAMIAALTQTETALAIALCHLLFNLFGVILLFPVRFIRNIPVWLAEQLGTLSYGNRLYGIFYVVVVFFVIPSLFIFSRAIFR